MQRQHCSLREAINASNASVGTPDTITFGTYSYVRASRASRQVPGGFRRSRIQPRSMRRHRTPLSTTPDVSLDRSDAGSVHGLNVTAGSTTIKGFVIDDFGVDGIHLQGGGNNTIVGNWVGPDCQARSPFPITATGSRCRIPTGTR